MKPTLITKALTQFIDNEAAGGIVLMVAALLALIIANSPLADVYFDSLEIYVGPLTVLHWINDGLMAIFFLLVGLEIKREFQGGELATWSQRALPAIAALGGMVVPALIYVWFNRISPATLAGWAIPSATDIAFALGILALLGKRVPLSLKVFLAALAIIDDLGAVLIIGIFYTANLNLLAFAGVVLVTAALVVLNMYGIKRLTLYLILGAILWFLMLKSGIHATLSGVILALAIPGGQGHHTPLLYLEHALNKWVAFLIVPIFGFANAGVSLQGIDKAALLQPVTLGIAAGLFLGKQLGVFGATWLAVKTGLTQMPKGASWAQVYGVSVLCGVGFTMSLFIGLLAFPNNEELGKMVKIGVLTGSILSAIAGLIVLKRAKPKA